MKKNLIIASLAICSTLILGTSVQAKVMPEQDNIARMQQKYVQPGGKKVGQSEKYIRIDNNSSGTQRVKEVNKEDFEKAQPNEEAKDNHGKRVRRDVTHNEDNKYDWVKLSLQAYDYNNGEYALYGFYEWKYPPRVSMGNEILSLTHGGNLSFDFSKSIAQVNNPVDFGGENGFKVETLTYSSSDFTQSSNGIAFEVPGPTSSLKGKRPFGMIQGRVHKSISGALNTNIIFTYAHKQLPGFLDPSISLGPTGLSLSGSEYAYDKATTGIYLDLR